jgi:hypothetical protein
MKGGPMFDRPQSAVFHVVTHVWGREYLDVFLNVCIPNQLAPGNAPALPPGSRYRILTRSIHVDELDAHPMVHELRKVIPVDIVVIEALDQNTSTARRYDMTTACHQQAVADAIQAEAALIFLSADFVFSHDALAAVVARHRTGYRAVVNTGLRLAKEAFLDWLEKFRVQLAELSSRGLVRVALPHLHPHTQSMCADAHPFSTFPVAVYWKVGSEGLVARCLHLHPLMVDPMGRVIPRNTIDGRYVAQACPDFSRVHVVTDSDELQMFELTPATRTVVPSGSARVSAWRVAAVAAACDELQRSYWQRYSIRLHTSGFDERWSAAAALSDAFADRVLRLAPYGRTARDWFWFLERIRQRRDRYRRVWRRHQPRVSLKQILRPLRLATHRSTKILRKSRHQLRRYVRGALM